MLWIIVLLMCCLPTGKPTIIGRSPLYPVLKPEDNYISTILLECHSVSTSIGDCPLSMHTLWYKNGMKVTDVDPTLSQINVTVDYNGGNFTCLATDYLPCYQRLQTTKHYDVLNIEECNNVFESETFIVQPEFAPIDVELEPDQREIAVYKNEDLKVRCTAKCHQKCTVTWGKHQGPKSSGFIDFTKNMFENDLVIENVNSSDEGYYGCLVTNIHGEVIKGFTLSVKEQKNGVAEESSPEEDEADYESVLDLHQDELLPEASGDNNSRNGEPGTSTDNNSRNGEPGTSTDNNSRNSDQYLNPEIPTFDVLEFNISNGNRNHGTNPEPENGYTRLSKKRHRKLKPKPKHCVLWQKMKE